MAVRWSKSMAGLYWVSVDGCFLSAINLRTKWQWKVQKNHGAGARGRFAATGYSTTMKAARRMAVDVAQLVRKAGA